MSMRSIGYSFNNAIADIIDNSITAEADRIEIECIWDGENPTVEIIDNGNGMNREELIAKLYLQQIAIGVIAMILIIQVNVDQVDG